MLRANASFRRGGPIADSEVILVDDRGEKQCFHLEFFYNGHEALTIFVYTGENLTRMPVSRVGAQNTILKIVRR